APGRGIRGRKSWVSGRRNGVLRCQGHGARSVWPTPGREWSCRRAGDRSAAGRTGRRGCRLALAKSDIDVAVYLLQAPPQLFDPIYRILDPAGQFAHLRLDPIHAKFGIDRSAGARGDNSAASTTIDLPLQHAEMPLQPIS